MATTNLDVIKDIPGYKVILKAVLKTQIQQLVEQLAAHTDEESVILTASVADGTLSHLGSDSGKSFLDDHEDVKSQFLGFCLKKHHRKKQIEKEKEREKEREKEQERLKAAQIAAQMPLPSFGGPRRGQSMFPRHSTPRHSPYHVPVRPGLDRRPSGEFIPPGGMGMHEQPMPPQMPPSFAGVLDDQNSGSIKQEGDGANPTGGEFSDNERSNSSSSTLPVDNTGANFGDSSQGNIGGSDSEGVSVKREVMDSEFDLEITGVEMGMPGMSQEEWAANVSMSMGMDPTGATGSQADMSGGQQGYNSGVATTTLNSVLKYPCQYCNKAFTSKWKVETHMRVHTGEKPFKCAHCGKSFNTKGNLKSHQVTHMKDFPGANILDDSGV